MDITALENQIKLGKEPKPVLVFSGPEEFLKERMTQKMVQGLIPAEDQGENFLRFDCNGKDASQVESNLYSFCFNTSPRIFLLNSFSNLNAAPRKDFLKTISQNGIPMNTILIFSVSDAKTSAEITGAFKQQSEKIDFWRPFDNQLPGWVKKEAGELGGKINNDAAELLLELTGSSLAVLFQELNKLIIAAAGKVVGVDQVRASVRYLNQDGIFDFLNNFGNRRSKEALRALEIMINSGEAPQKIWFMLCRQLRDFRLLHDLNADRPDLYSEAIEILRSYGRIAEKTDFKANQEKKSLTGRLQKIAETFPPYLAEVVAIGNSAKSRNLYMAMNFNRSELVKAWPLLIKTDLLLKSGVPDATTALQTFTLRFLSGDFKSA